MDERSSAKVRLIPVPIAEDAVQSLPASVLEATRSITHYFAENARTARRMIKKMHPDLNIESFEISEIDKHEGPDKELFLRWLKQGLEIGIMSEAGCPGIADPGAELVAVAHQQNVAVIPLTGPSSLLLALMASGLNGQSFSFAGYLPVKDPERTKKLKQLEERSRKENQTQLFIETPYRNNQLLADLLKHCDGNSRLCIASGLTGAKEFIKTKSIAEWKKTTVTLEKEPAVFLLLA